MQEAFTSHFKLSCQVTLCGTPDSHHEGISLEMNAKDATVQTHHLSITDSCYQFYFIDDV